MKNGNIVYKEKLPKDCPPKEAKQEELNLYRITKHETIEESDFEPYVNIYPMRHEYKEQCKAYSISLYKELEKAKEIQKKLKKKNKDSGDYILLIKIRKEFGKIKINETNSHCSLWLFNNININDFEIMKIFNA